MDKDIPKQSSLPRDLEALGKRLSNKHLLCTKEIVNSDLKTQIAQWEIIQTDNCECKRLRDNTILLTIRLRSGNEYYIPDHNTNDKKFIEENFSRFIPVYELVESWKYLQDQAQSGQKPDITLKSLLAEFDHLLQQSVRLPNNEKGKLLDLLEQFRNTLSEL